jgi:hypothetical protein
MDEGARAADPSQARRMVHLSWQRSDRQHRGEHGGLPHAVCERAAPSGAHHWFATFNERLAKLFVPGPSSARMFSAAEYLLSEAAQVARQTDSRLVVVSVPFKAMLSPLYQRDILHYLPKGAPFDVGYPDRQLSEICSRHGITFVAGMGEFDIKHYLRDDPHWNAAGHKKVANLLQRLFTKYGVARAPGERASIASAAASKADPLRPVSYSA